MRRLLALMLCCALLALIVTGCDSRGRGDTQAAAAPDAAVRVLVQRLREADLAGFWAQAMPPPVLARFKAQWAAPRDTTWVSQTQRETFATVMQRLTAPEAETRLYDELAPTLNRFNAQSGQEMPMIVAMARGYLGSLVRQNDDYSEADKQALIDLVGAFGDWITQAQPTDPERLRRVLPILVRTARELDLKSVDDVLALDYEQSMAKSQIALRGLRDVLTVYGFSLTQALDSATVQVVSNDGGAAVVRVDCTLFGAARSIDVDLVALDGRWYPRRFAMPGSGAEPGVEPAAAAAAD